MPSPLVSKSGGLQIFVQDLVGQTCLDLSPDATVADVIAELEREGKRGQLTWQGQAVQPTASLADLGVCPESVMTLSPATADWEEPATADVRVERVHADGAVGSRVARVARSSARAFVLGPEAPLHTAWEWEVVVPAGSHSSNLYIGVTSPDVDRECVRTRGLYSVQKGASMWMLVNDSFHSSSKRTTYVSRKCRLAELSRVRATYCPTASTLSFAHVVKDVDEAVTTTFDDVTGQLALFTQFESVGSALTLLYSGPPRPL
eukprot:TRINITY_DN1399_c0_g1_i1.p1 TRINITY_DN1399_c0_g1~~TRINITY_DN1399_c0_g1_i1.p1  ORF type:complete len:283 (+),score=53.60 TRINITY_DN1399_c0_g1_i1:69-851(+)